MHNTGGWLPPNKTRRVTTGPITMVRGRRGLWAQFIVYWDMGVRSGQTHATVQVNAS